MLSFLYDENKKLLKELFSNKNDLSKAEKIIKKGIDINKQDENGNSLLFLLASQKKYKAVKLLLDNGANKYLENKFHKNPLDEACEKSDISMVKLLLDNGYDVNHKNSIGRTILQDTAILGNEEIFNVLTSYNPNFDIKDNEGKTVLFYAVECKNLNILRETIKKVSNINEQDINGETALFHAVLKNNNLNITNLLLSHKDIDVNILNNNGENALFNAIILGEENIPTIKALIDKKINVNVVDNNHKNILEEILYIVNLQMDSLDNLKGKYKFIFAQKNYLSLVKLFIENGLNIDKLDSNGKTTLQKEIENKNLVIADFLIKSGANINILDKNNRNILFNEILKGYSNYEIVDFLIQNGADINIRDIEEKNVIDIIVELIAISKNIKELTPELEDIYNPDEDYDFLLKKVLTYKPNINMPRKNGTNVLFDLVLYNDFQTLNTIFEYGAKIDIQDENGRTPLANMIKQGLKIKEKDERDKFIERLVNLLRYKKDVDVQDKEGRTVLHDAVIAGDNLVVEKLIRKKANLSIKDMHGRTALHHTKWTGNSQIAKWLIAGGVDINEPDNTGFTILNYATILGHAKLIMTLIDAGVLMNNRNPKSKKVAQFFKDREKNLDKMILENSSDAYVKSSLQTVVENLKKEVNEVLYGNVPKSDFSI